MQHFKILLIALLFSLLKLGLLAQDSPWFAIDCENDLVWLTRQDLLDIDGDGINEFIDLDSKWSASYILVENIEFNGDSSDVDWNGDGLYTHLDDAGLMSIGTDEHPFTGHFNGKYHTIKNLYKTGSAGRNGLFGVINGATIENLKLEDIRFYSATAYNGGIVGRADKVLAPGDSNMIQRCIVSGNFILTSTTNNLYTGGVVGRTDNIQIKECAAFVKILAIGDSTNNRRVGGIAGQIGGNASIANSYSISEVSAYEQSGLLVARSYDDSNFKIRNSYAAGNVNATTSPPESTLGVFAGAMGTPDMVSCYFDTSLSLFPGVGLSEIATDLTGLSTESFSLPANFKEWDFTKIWHIKTHNDILRPRLQWENLLESPPDLIDFLGAKPYPGPLLQWERTKEIVGIKEYRQTELTVFPNPADDFLFIEICEYPENVSIMNSVGLVKIRTEVTPGLNRIDVSHLPPGVYFIRFNSSFSKFIKY